MTSAVNPAATSGDEREHAPSADSNGNGTHADASNGGALVAVAERVEPRLEGVPPAAPVAPLPRAAGAGGARGFIRSLRTFDSLKTTHYRWFFLAMFGWFSSMNMQMLVRGYLVFDLTGSYAALGAVSLANAIPGLLLSLFGGVVADRFPKRLVVQIGQTVSALNALVIAGLLIADVLSYPHLLISAVVQGTVVALMMPSRQAMISDIVPPRLVMNAIALNSAGMNLARLSIPAIGGLVLAAAGAAWVYFLMCALYAFSVVTLTKVPKRPIEFSAEDSVVPDGMPQRRMMRGGGGRGGGGRGGLRELRAGLAYVAHEPTLRTVLIINFLFVLCSMPYMQMLPGFVDDVLEGGPGTLGLLMSITGIGSLAGSLVVASLPSRRRGRLLIFGAGFLGVALIAFSLSTTVAVTAVIMVFIGIGQSARMSLSNVIIQTKVEDEYRGRVMSLYMMEMSLTQFGSFGVGILASIFGVQAALGGAAAMLIVIAVCSYLFVPRLRDLD